MYELVYCSTGSEDLSSEDIAAILKKSRESNAQNNITGCLMYYNHEFIQILEGEEKMVQEVFSKIENDSRHSNVTLLAKGEKEKKQFSHWSMAFYKLNIDEIKDMGKEVFIDNFITFSELADKPTFPSLLFWNKACTLLRK